MNAWLLGASIQKVERPTPGVVVLSLRAPGESVTLAVIGAREGVAIGALGERRAAAGKPRRDGTPAKGPEAELMRLRKQLEGARVLAIARVGEGAESAMRLRAVRGGEVRALVATRDGVTLVELEELAAEGERTPASAADAEGVLTDADAASASGEATKVLARIERALFDEARRALVAAVARTRKKLERRVEALAEDLAKIEGADEHARLGALLIANAYAIPRGAREALLDDWTSGERVEVRVPLDPAKSAKEQAEALFHRSKRLKRGRAIAEARKAEATRGVEALAALEREALAALDPRALEIVGARARGAGVAGARVQLAQKRKGPPPRVPYNVYLSGERRILVGRGAADNDALTTKTARPHDLWLHAKSIHGAHVVVPLAKGESCPSDLLVDAAHLAAHFSDARGEKVVEIQHTTRRYVRKPKGSAPGAVVLDRETVLVLRIEPGRVERLLATGG
jgi:hypothetical protein